MVGSEPLFSQTWALRLGPRPRDPDPPVPLQHQEPKLSGIPRPEAASPKGQVLHSLLSCGILLSPFFGKTL